MEKYSIIRKKPENVIIFCNHIFGGSVDMVILRHLLKGLEVQFEKASTSQNCLHLCINKNNDCSVLKCISYAEVLSPS